MIGFNNINNIVNIFHILLVFVVWLMKLSCCFDCLFGYLILSLLRYIVFVVLLQEKKSFRPFTINSGIEGSLKEFLGPINFVYTIFLKYCFYTRTF